MRVNLVRSLLMIKEFSALVGADMLDISRTTTYCRWTSVLDAKLTCKAIVNRLHTNHLTWGATQYMNGVDIYSIYPKINFSKRMLQVSCLLYTSDAADEL